MVLSLEQVEALIQIEIPDATVEVKDLTGTSDHFSATVTSASFAGKSKIEQHKMVYKALGKDLGNAVHALQLTTKIP